MSATILRRQHFTNSNTTQIIPKQHILPTYTYLSQLCLFNCDPSFCQNHISITFTLVFHPKLLTSSLFSSMHVFMICQSGLLNNCATGGVTNKYLLHTLTYHRLSGTGLVQQRGCFYIDNDHAHTYNTHIDSFIIETTYRTQPTRHGSIITQKRLRRNSLESFRTKSTLLVLYLDCSAFTSFLS